MAALKKFISSISIMEVLSINEIAANIRQITPIPAEIHAIRVNVLISLNLSVF